MFTKPPHASQTLPLSNSAHVTRTLAPQRCLRPICPTYPICPARVAGRPEGGPIILRPVNHPTPQPF